MTWHQLTAEKWLLYSQIGLKLVDEFTARPPSYPVFSKLEYQDSVGDWHPVHLTPVVTPTGVVSYPALGRSAQATTQPVLKYRVLLFSEYYRPEYLVDRDGIEFDIYPYDDNHPPAVIPQVPQTILMIPNTRYSFPGHVRLVKGLVQDHTGNPVVNVEVSEGVQERVLSDERGAFTLPLRWPALNAVVSLDAIDRRTGRHGSLNITVPGDLFLGHIFTIT